MQNTPPPALCQDCQHGYHDIPFHLPLVVCSCPCHGVESEDNSHFPLDALTDPTYNKDRGKA